MPEFWKPGGFGLYVHWPFCMAKCPYCDFNSYVADQIDVESWETAYLSDLDRYGSETGGRVLNSVYFGGGTPSLMPPDLVGAIMDRLGAHWRLANDFEATLEANPTSVESSRFLGYREAGINRLSLGVQALNDRDLRALGRMHTVDQALTALDLAMATFERVSFDLIYARQHQTLEDWREELSRALSFGPRHLSLYQLTIEDGTVFGERARRGMLRGLPDEDLGADMFYLTQEMCEIAGLRAYELSNYAAPGDESRHNMIYWRGGDYIGIGPGAHGRVTVDGNRFATETELAPRTWLQNARHQGGELKRALLSPRDIAGEYLMMGLRTFEGVDLARLVALAAPLPDQKVIDDLTELSLLVADDRYFRATRSGLAVLNSIISKLLPE